MTNKLRSVIEDARCRLIANQQDKETDYIHIVDVHKHVEKTSLELLDEIIEEMEKDYSTDSGAGGIVMCLSPVLYAQIQKLKQAREELSTSLTQ